jgi:hypothetical protein
MSQYYARIDYLRYSDMEKLNDLVVCVKRFASDNPNSDPEDYIRQVAEKIEDLFEGKVGQFEYVVIVQLLRRLARFVSFDRGKLEDEKVVNLITAEIIKIVQGDNKMNKEQFTSMVYCRVIEAVNKSVEKADFIRLNGREEGPSISDIAEDTATRIVEDVFGGKIPLEAELVSRYYEMDSETENVLHNGTLVIDGMKVLIEDPSCRVEVTGDMTPEVLANARMKNRWCTVEESRIDRLKDGTPMLTFVGAYDDGVKRKWNIAASYAWIVKTDSIPRIDRVLDPGGNEVHAAPTAKILEFFKRTDTSYHARYSIMIGDTDITMPADQYVLSGGDVREPGHVLRKAAIGDTEVFDEDGLSVISGTVHDLLAWAESLPEDSKYQNYRLRYGGYDKLTTVRKFIEKPVWDGREGRESIYSVIAKDGGVIFGGTKPEVMEYLCSKPATLQRACKVGLADGNVNDAISGELFRVNNT